MIENIQQILAAQIWSPNEKFESEAYKKLMARGENDPYVKMWKFLTNAVNSVNPGLPGVSQLHTLPGVAKTDKEALMRGDIKSWVKGKFHNPNDNFHQLSKSAFVDSVTHEPIRTVPVFYSNPLDEETQNFDVAQIFSIWYEHASDYLLTSSVEPYMWGVLYNLKQARVLTGQKNKGLMNKGLPQVLGLAPTKEGANLIRQFEAWMD